MDVPHPTSQEYWSGTGYEQARDILRNSPPGKNQQPLQAILKP